MNPSVRRPAFLLFALLLAALASCTEENTYITAEDATAPVTTAVPSGGAYIFKQNVVLVVSEAATVHYTTDGSNPTTASTVYTAPIPLFADTTLKYFAVDGSGNTEAFRTEIYVFPYVVRLFGAWQNASNTANPSQWAEIAVDSTNAPTGATCVAVDSNDTVHVVWRENVGGTNWEIVYANSTNWSTTRTIISNSPDMENVPYIAVDSTGVAHVVWERFDSTLLNLEILYANSSNWATTQANISNTGDQSNTPRIAIDSNDIAHVVWREDTVSDNEIYYADSTNWATTRVNISGTSNHSYDARIALDANDDVHVAWTENLGGGNFDIHYAVSPNWAMSRVNVSNTADYSSSPALAVDSAGIAHVTWQETIGGTLDEVYYVNSTDWVRTSTVLSKTTNNSLAPAMAADGAGRIHVAWTEDLGPGGREIYYARTAD
jgi:hypothetical protein